MSPKGWRRSETVTSSSSQKLWRSSVAKRRRAPRASARRRSRPRCVSVAWCVSRRVSVPHGDVLGEVGALHVQLAFELAKPHDRLERAASLRLLQKPPVGPSAYPRATDARDGAPSPSCPCARSEGRRAAGGSRDPRPLRPSPRSACRSRSLARSPRPRGTPGSRRSSPGRTRERQGAPPSGGRGPSATRSGCSAGVRAASERATSDGWEGRARAPGR